MSQNIKIKVDRDLCIGAGTCEVVLSEVFKVDSDGRVALVGGDKLSDYNNVTLEQVLEAAKSCPTLAIKIVDADTGVTIYPK